MKELIVLDIETTGVDFVRDDVIEISAVKLRGNEVVDKFTTLVKPTMAKLGPTVATLTNIQPADLEGAPVLAEVKDGLLTFCGELPIVGHNISFDVDFLKEKGVNLPGDRLDTLELAYTLLPKLPFYSMEFLSYYYQFKDPPSHRAMNDVLATVELYDLLLSQVNQIPADIRQQIDKLIGKTSWDWSFIFTDNLVASGTYQPRVLPVATPEPAEQTLINVADLSAGFNVFELLPNVDQLSFNITLAKQLPKSILVVGPNVFVKTNWSARGISPYFSSTYQLDPERFQFLLNKPSLDAREFKLLIKILLHGFSDGEFIPGKIYLTRRDEFYLFEQRLAPLTYRPQNLPDRMVTDFASWVELSEAGMIEADRVVLIPQWIDLDEWWVEHSTKWMTIAYFNAVVASRRDFVHDFIADHKLADQLFKSLNELSSHLTMTAGLLGMLWQEHSKNGDVVEWEERFLTTKNGAALKDNVTGVIATLSDYQTAIAGAAISFPEVAERQINHTAELIGYLNCIISPEQAYKVYIDGRSGGFSLRIIKQQPENIWQTKLNDHQVVIVSNGVTVSGNSSFISSTLGVPELIEVKTLSKPDGENKDMVWVDGLPNPKAVNYQKLIFPYLRRQLEGEPGHNILVLPTARMVEEFFNESQPIVKAANFLSFDIAGNEVVLGGKLASWDQFALVVSQHQAPYLLGVAPELDRVIYTKLAFDSPGMTPQLLAIEKFSNSFMDYGLPRAVVAFKMELAKLYPKVKEVWMLDSRLITQDWGRPVRKSIGGFRHVDITAE
ncbi:MAG: exonuclease domain-containing protein [Patescibacteria group bacterium]|jgi:DNA polymerase III epsilon subunit-like protein